MFEVTILDLKTRRNFIKKFSSPYLLNKFVKKCSYSDKIKILYTYKIY